MALITQTKEYTTRRGSPVRLYDFWPNSRLPVVGAVLYRGGWSIERWTADGCAYNYGITSPQDLIEKEETNGCTTTTTCS
jgi:hypothetical protein